MKRRLSTSDGTHCGMQCRNTNEPARLMCSHCLVYYHQACINLSARIKVVGYVCLNCRIIMKKTGVLSSHSVVVCDSSSKPEKQLVKGKENLSKTTTIDELTTPTFNLTSSNTGVYQNAPSTDGNINSNIGDAIYKLPFEYGWKRELVYRSSGESAVLNQANRTDNVYYYSPNNQKLRSLQEIQEYLDISSDKTSLTIDSFTFLTQPIGMNNPSKEVIDDTTVGVAVQPKKCKTTEQRPPFDYELSDDENKKTAGKLKMVFKNAKTSSRLISKKGNFELMNTSSSTQEYTSKDLQAIKFRMSTKVSPELENIDINTKIMERRNSEINGSFKEISTLFTSMQSLNNMVKALEDVFKYLNTHELISASRVCTTWHMIAMNKFLWQNVRLKNSMVYDWERFVDSIDQQRTYTLDTRQMLIPINDDEFKNFWLHFSKAMKRAHKLKFIELYRCPTHIVEDIIHSLPQLEVLNATSIKNQNVTKDSKNPHDLMALNLNYLGQMTKLTELRLKGLNGIKLTSLPSFENLINLNKFSLTSIKSFPKNICQSLNTITDNIEFLEIGDCDFLSKDFAMLLKRFVNLKSLRLENCYGKWESCAQDVFTAIRGLEKLTILELVNIEFSNCVEDELEKCVDIKALLIIPAYMSKSATTNCHLIDCLRKLSKTLTHLVWGLTLELLRVTDLFITQYQQNQHSIGNNLELSHTKETTIPIRRTRKPRQRPEEEPALKNGKDEDKSDIVDLHSVFALEKLLATMMPDAKTRVIKIPFSGTVRVYLSELFNDL